MASWRERARDELPLVVALFAAALLISVSGLCGTYYFNDVEHYNLPVRAFFAQGWRAGILRWWCPELGAGYPLFAEGQGGPAYPGNLLFLLVRPLWLAFTASVITHLFWAGLGVAACLRQLGCSRSAALVGGFCYMLSGPVYFRVVHLNFLHGLAWLPWVMWGLERGVRGLRGGFVTAGVALAMQMLAGHAHPLMLSLLLSAPYVLVRAWVRWQPGLYAAWQVFSVYLGFAVLVVAALKAPLAAVVLAPGLLGGLVWLRDTGRDASRAGFARSLGGLATTGGLAVLLAAVQVLPLLELIRHSERADGLSVTAATEIALQPAQLYALLLPQLHGSPCNEDLAFKLQWGIGIHWEWAAHVGVVPLLLFVLAPVLGRRRERWVFLLLGVVALLLAMGETLPFYRWLLRLPGWHSVRGPARMLGLFALAAAMVAGFTVDDLRQHGWPERRRGLVVLALLAAVAMLCAAAVMHLRAALPFVPLGHKVSLTLAWFRAVALALAGAALLLRARAAADAHWGPALALLVAIDMFSGSAGYHYTRPASTLAPPAEMAQVTAQRGRRILVDVYQPSPMQANRHLLYPGVDNLAIYTPLKLKRYNEALGMVGDLVRDENIVARRWLAMLRVTLAQHRLFDRFSRTPGELVETGLRPFPRAWVTPRWEVARTPADAWKMVAWGYWRPEAYSVLETPAAPAPRRGSLSEVLWTEYGRHRVTCRVSGDSPRVLVLGQTWYPGWRVRVEPAVTGGAWSPSEPVDYLLCGKLLGPGVQRVDFVFMPLSIRLGLFGSLLGLAAVVAWTVALGCGHAGVGADE